MVLGSGIARAADVSPHLVGMARSLISQIDQTDFAASGDPALAQRTAEIVRLTRLRSWAGASPKIAVDPTKLAAPLGLDFSQDGHRAALEQVLAARDPAARRDALGAVLQLTGRRQTQRDIDKIFRDALAEQLGALQKRATVEAGSGQSIEIEWDPDTASVLARINLGEGQDEVVLHGGAAGKIVDGELTYDVEADTAPVTRITPSMEAEINANVFGVWRGRDGAQWMIRGGPEVEAAAHEKTDPAASALEEIDRARQQLAAVEKEKVYIWVDPKGGEVIQKKFKRLGPPFRYDRTRSENMHKSEIAALRERIAAAERALQLPPAKQHDPLQLKNKPGGTSRAVEIEVWEASGRRYLYDEAAFDGKRLTASRTLRDVRDIFDLPDWVIKGLVDSWSPPEWIEFEAKFNPRDKSVSLEGLWWRLNVTYDPQYQDIKGIHTPYSKPLVLQREHENIMLRIVDLEGKPREVIRHDEPFRLQARFTEAPNGDQQALIKGERGDASVDLAPAGDGSDARLHESGILYARSVQFAQRKDVDGLFFKERFVDENEFDAKTAEWRKLTQRSQEIAADLFKGNWRVSHALDGAVTGLAGIANVDASGASARMALADGTQLYQSIDMRASRGQGEEPHFLEINFERVDAFGQAPAVAAPAPLPKGRIIHFPTLTRGLQAELKQAHASAGLDLKPASEIINVLLKSRGDAHLAGGWHEILGTGDHGQSGQETWLRDIEITGIVVMEDQTRRDSPTVAYYPSGRASGGTSTERTLFIFGKHLPSTAGDAVIFESLTEGMSYHAPRFPNEMPQQTVDDAWRKAAAVPKPEPESGGAAASAGDAEMTGLFVTARFQKGAEPGVKALTLNDAPGLWLLDFADARGRAYFIDTPPIDGAPTDFFQSSDTGFLELELETPIPYKAPLVFRLSRDGADAGQIPLTLLVGEGSEGREGRVYRSPPLHFYRSDRENWAPPDEAGALKFDVAPIPGTDPKKDNRLIATWTQPLRLSIPKPAEVQIVDEDDEEMAELWRKALERAAACYGGRVKIDPRATSQENSHFFLTELGSRKTQITIGDHAAALLIRDEFVKFSRAVAETYAELGYESELDKFIEAGVASAGRSDPLWKVMSIETAGKTYTAEQMLDLDALALTLNVSRERAIVFRRNQMLTMARNYASSINASIARASAAKDCKVDELLVIAGQPAPMIAARILPRLVTRREEGGRIFWEPDVVARAYVRTLYIKGAELRALEEYAAIDDTYKALALAAAGGGVAALASRLGYLGAAAYATVTADAIDMVYFGGKGVLDYQKGEEFYEYAKGASATMGADFYEEAAAQRHSALATAAGVLLPGAGVAAGTLGDLRHLGRVERGAEIARRFDTVDAATLARLSETERLDLLAYVDEIQETTRLGNLTGFTGKAEAIATSTGRRLDPADTKFLDAFNAHTADVQAQIGRGRGVAARLDDLDDAALNGLTPAERADLAAYVENIRFRQAALTNDDFGKSLAVPSAREAELAGKFDEMTKASGAAGSPTAVAKVDVPADPLPSPPAPTPGMIAKVENPVGETRAVANPPPPEMAVPKPGSTVIDDLPSKAPGDQASFDRPLPETAPEPGQSRAPSPPPRIDNNSARGPPPDGADTVKPDDITAIDPPVIKPRPEGDLDKTPLDPAPGRIDPPDPDATKDFPPPPARVDDNNARGPPPDDAIAKPDDITALDPPVIKPRPDDDLDRIPLGPSPGPGDLPDPNVTKDFPPGFVNEPPAPGPVRPVEPVESTPQPVEWGPPLAQGTVIPLRGNPEGVPPIVVEHHLAAGSNNSVYAVPRFPEEDTSFVARISKREAGSLADRVDQEGWRALAEISDDALYVPKRKGPFEIDGEAVGRPDLDGNRLELVEHVPERATEQFPANGIPTAGQAIALDRAKRALNAKGFVWLDNHPGNYGFKPRGGPDEWQVVIFDPGGIVKVADEAGNPADVARRFQTRLENPVPEVGRRLENARAAREGKVQNMWNAVAREQVLDDFGRHIDLSRLDIDDPAKIPFRADGMVFYPNVRALSRIDDPAALEDAYKALRAGEGGPPAANLDPMRSANTQLDRSASTELDRSASDLPSTLPPSRSTEPPPPADLPPSSSDKTPSLTEFDPDEYAELSPARQSSQADSDALIIMPPARITRPVANALNLEPQSIMKNWRGQGNGAFDVAGRPLKPDGDVMNPVGVPVDLLNPNSARPKSAGLFADVRVLRDADGNPTGYVSKTYGERRRWVKDERAPVDPATGRCTRPCWKDQRVQSPAEAKAMAEDTLHGARILEASGIPQLDIVAHDLGGFPPRIVQRALGKNMPATSDGRVVEEVFADSKLVNGKLAPPYAEAFAELVGNLRRNGVFWEDMHLGNMIFQKVKRGDGSEYWRAGVSDTDRIDLFENPRAGREPNEWMRNFEEDPAWNNLKSRAPNQILRDSEDAMIAALEHKGHVRWDPARRCFIALKVPSDVLKAQLPGLQACP